MPDMFICGTCRSIDACEIAGRCFDELIRMLPAMLVDQAPRVPRDFWGNINFIYKGGRLDVVHVHSTERIA